MNLAVELGMLDAYSRAKALLNAGRHPAFVGPQMIARAAANGGLLFAVAGCGRKARDAAVAVVNPHNSTLLVLNVHPAFRRAGVGAWFLEYLRPNFARVVAFAVPWFEHQGYAALGIAKTGRRLSTQIMVRRELVSLSGRAARCLGPACTCDQPGINNFKAKGLQVDVKNAELPGHRHRGRQGLGISKNPMPLSGNGPSGRAVVNTIHQCHHAQAMPGD